jgi:L-fucono-1,5-lactonase
LIDAHQHFWDPAEARYPFLDEADAAPLRRRFDAEDIAPLLREHGVDGTVAVQARSSVGETEMLLAIAAATPFVLGVVGWVDLTAADVVDTLARFPLAGIRHQVHDEEDPRWLLRDDVQRGLAAVADAGLAYDLLVRTRELPAAIETARRRPSLRLVLDHVAKPPLTTGRLDEWAEGVEALAAFPNVSCKLSGLVTEGPRGELLSSCLDRALEWFGADRCLFGSDWPVCTLAADYGEVLQLVEAALDGASSSEREAVLAGTARRVYRLTR